MGRREQNIETLFEDMDGPYLVGLGNWLAESLELPELKNEHVLLLYMVLERSLGALWRAFPEVLSPLIMRKIAGLESDDDDK